MPVPVEKVYFDVVPLTLGQANDFVTSLHRHHKKTVGHRFSIGAVVGGKLVGVCIVGRPVARKTDQYNVAEVTRLCTDGTTNACSVLYGAAARAAKELGFQSIQTFTLPSEGGASLRASGWENVGQAGGGSWSCESRPREDNHPLEPKTKWVKTLKRGKQ
jgi:hypothetical protein